MVIASIVGLINELLKRASLPTSPDRQTWLGQFSETFGLPLSLLGCRGVLTLSCEAENGLGFAACYGEGEARIGAERVPAQPPLVTVHDYPGAAAGLGYPETEAGNALVPTQPNETVLG